MRGVVSPRLEPFGLPERLKQQNKGDVMRTQIRYWLDYDPVALVVLLVGIGMVELLALSI